MKKVLLALVVSCGIANAQSSMLEEVVSLLVDDIRFLKKELIKIKSNDIKLKSELLQLRQEYKNKNKKAKSNNYLSISNSNLTINRITKMKVVRKKGTTIFDDPSYSPSFINSRKKFTDIIVVEKCNKYKWCKINEKDLYVAQHHLQKVK